MTFNGRPARRWLTARTLSSGAAIMALTLAAHPALAQGTPEARLDKVESEVRALQRKVFPGPDGKYFEPQVTTGQAAAPATGTPPPATTAVTDLLTRMDSIEAQMRQLTSQVEQNTNRINLIEARMGSQLQAGVAATSPPASTAAATGAVGPGFTPAAAPVPAPVATPTPKPTASAPAAKPVAPSSARVEAVKAIVKPQTADAGDDEYSYGFRLWEAKFYPEAEQQLKAYLQKYPKHARVSYARNLLGRAYLDEGNASEAAKWFWQNYLADKRGDRAPDSLLYLAVSMKQLKDTNRACIALAEFSETYATEAAGRLKGLYDSTRSGLSCS
ncbi:tol-pal system YbgF family protein [Novosphingobium colocasiae]|uniref:tol-pal system YbgF family protein n=1 Tax=Novosphingobium colocasiae TaxID=1256513 RepID=UPI0035B43A1C